MPFYTTSVEKGGCHTGTDILLQLLLLFQLLLLLLLLPNTLCYDVVLFVLQRQPGARVPLTTSVGDDFFFVMAGPSAGPRGRTVGAGSCFAIAGQSAGLWW